MVCLCVRKDSSTINPHSFGPLLGYRCITKCNLSFVVCKAFKITECMVQNAFHFSKSLTFCLFPIIPPNIVGQKLEKRSK